MAACVNQRLPSRAAAATLYFTKNFIHFFFLLVSLCVKTFKSEQKTIRSKAFATNGSAKVFSCFLVYFSVIFSYFILYLCEWYGDHHRLDFFLCLYLKYNFNIRNIIRFELQLFDKYFFFHIGNFKASVYVELKRKKSVVLALRLYFRSCKSPTCGWPVRFVVRFFFFVI